MSSPHKYSLRVTVRWIGSTRQSGWRVVASAGFHGGRLATDAPDSPHLLAPKIKAKVYVGGADEDAGFPPEQAEAQPAQAGLFE